MSSAIESAIRNTERKISTLRAEAKITFDKYIAVSNAAATPEKREKYLRLAIRVAEHTEILISEAKKRLQFLKSPAAKKKRR